ncbi:MAG: glycosyltransferase family 9 protein [Acidobacteriota bacterium]|jgi:heptosyltransferase-2
MSAPWVVRLPNWLGDTVMTLPTVRALARIADGPLLLWGPPGHAEVWALSGLDFDYLPYPRRRGLRGVSDAIHACAQLRHREPALALLVTNAFEPALLTAAALVPRRIGFATDGRGALLTDLVPEPYPRHAVHEAERFAAPARHLGAEIDLVADAGLIASDALRARATAVLPPGNRYLGLAAGSANTPFKRWPVAAWAELARTAHDAWGAVPVLLGSNADRPVNEELAALTGVELMDLSGCDLTDLAASLLRCRVVVSNDSGAAHLAAALDRPTVVVFGPTDPARSLPLGTRVAAVTAPTFCRPCGFGYCPFDHRCMNDLSAGAVFDVVARWWATTD